ncbi:MAG TPA: hypothetical protein VK539_31055 [Myxococcaceae bacterium]|nr:hypothetical protein [Myxococcaceae bacterium]
MLPWWSRQPEMRAANQPTCPAGSIAADPKSLPPHLQDANTDSTFSSLTLIPRFTETQKELRELGREALQRMTADAQAAVGNWRYTVHFLRDPMGFANERWRGGVRFRSRADATHLLSYPHGLPACLLPTLGFLRK